MGQFELGVPLREGAKISGIACRRRSRIYWGRKEGKLVPMTASNEARGTRDWCDSDFNGLPSSVTVTFTDIIEGGKLCTPPIPLLDYRIMDYSQLNGSYVLTYGPRIAVLGDVLYCGYSKPPFTVTSNPDPTGQTYPVAIGISNLFFPVLQVWKIFIQWILVTGDMFADSVWNITPGLGYEKFAAYPYLDGMFPQADGQYVRTDGWNYVMSDGASVS